MPLKVEGKIKIKQDPRTQRVGDKDKSWTVAEYSPWENAQYPQSVIIEGWGAQSELVAQRYAGEEVNLLGTLNITSKKDEMTGEYKNFISIKVESFPGVRGNSNNDSRGDNSRYGGNESRSRMR